MGILDYFHSKLQLYMSIHPIDILENGAPSALVDLLSQLQLYMCPHSMEILDNGALFKHLFISISGCPIKHVLVPWVSLTIGRLTNENISEIRWKIC